MSKDDDAGPDETTAAKLDVPIPLSMNQLVAYNFMRARRASGWTQEECAARLTKLTGRSWTNATVSAAERSWETGRVREFNANELMAFCAAFRKPLASFFMPMEDTEHGHVYLTRRLADEESTRTPEEMSSGGTHEGYFGQREVLDYVVPFAHQEKLSEEVNRTLESKGLTWSPGTQRFDWRQDGEIEWPSLAADEDRAAVEELLERAGDADPMQLRREMMTNSRLWKSTLGIDPQFLEALIEEAAEAGVRNFITHARDWIKRNPEDEGGKRE